MFFSILTSHSVSCWHVHMCGIASPYQYKLLAQTCMCTHDSAPLFLVPGAGATSPGGYLNLRQHSSQHAGADTSLEALYGENAMWINHHQHGHGSRQGTARMWRSGNYGRY